MVIKNEDGAMSSDDDHLSPILEGLFVKYTAFSTCVCLADGCNDLRIVLSPTSLLFHFTTSYPVTMRNKYLDHVIRL